MSTLEIDKVKLLAENETALGRLAVTEQARQAADSKLAEVNSSLMQAQSALASVQSSLQNSQRDNERLNTRMDEKEKQLNVSASDLKEACLLSIHSFM